MKTLFSKIVITLFCLVQLSVFYSFACTSLIISGSSTASGKPLMYKHRDTGEMNNRIEYFRGPKYSFIGLVNSSHKNLGEVWTGTNTVGFSIMNTASYNIKDDDVPSKEMDKEGILMYKALGVCKNLDDFEHFLDTLSRPMGVEANFGVIDAEGGCAYYEVNNHKWVKYVVDDYKVVTNFSFSGRKEDYQGYERYLTACEIMDGIKRNKDGKFELNHSDIFNDFSRSYRHSLLGIKDLKNVSVAVDQDFIPRKITSASTVVEGVRPGEDPFHTVMWSILGYPACSVAIPLLVSDCDIIPEYMKKTSDSENCLMCDKALQLKGDWIFKYKISNGNKYFDPKIAYSMIDICSKVEKKINSDFYSLFNKWTEGKMTSVEFYKSYSENNTEYYNSYLSAFASFSKND